MAASLKGSNRLVLFSAVVLNAALFYSVVEYDTITLDKSIIEIICDLKNNWVWPSVAFILVPILNGLLSADTKARIVFFRWKNPLPGSYAFSRYGPEDPRVDMDAIKGAYGPLPSAPDKENALWYRLYKRIENDPSVLEAHRLFLLSRDFHCLSIIILISFGVAAIILIRSSKITAIYLALLIMQYLLSGVSARNYGKRFVTTVLARTAAERARREEKDG